MNTKNTLTVQEFNKQFDALTNLIADTRHELAWLDNERRNFKALDIENRSTGLILPHIAEEVSRLEKSIAKKKLELNNLLQVLDIMHR